ncbi:MAG: retroviral-like aspartic protease family protein [Gammaproteobacteria bacterium]
MAPNYQALTVRANPGGRLSSLKTPCSVCLAFNPLQGGISPQQFQFEAIWDTGATNSVITQRVVSTCHLLPIGMTKVHAVNSTKDSEVYLVNIGLPNRVNFMNIKVTQGELIGTDVLIGMDIITLGDVAITNVDGNTVFSFRIPSQKHVDFIHEHTEESRREQFSHGGSKKNRKKRHKMLRVS